MSDDIKMVIGVAVNIIIVTFMIISGIWVAIDARKHGRPAKEYITWGLFTAGFIGVGLIVYILWRKHIFPQY